MTATTPRLLLPAKERSQGGARFDVAAVEEALDFLEIDRPVEIKWSAGLRRRGAHRCRDGRHVVTVSTYLDGTEASRTLWHELTHATQAERFESEEAFTRAYRAQGRSGYRYERNRFEVEAREVTESYGDEFRLTKEER